MQAENNAPLFLAKGLKRLGVGTPEDFPTSSSRVFVRGGGTKCKTKIDEKISYSLSIPYGVE